MIDKKMKRYLEDVEVLEKTIIKRNIVILVGKKENVNYGEKAKEEIKFQV